MKKIIITGTLSQPFGSFPVASQSDDGVTWDAPSIPFQVNQSPTAVATDGTTIVISNALGDLAVSNNNMQSFSLVTVNDGFSISGLGYSNGDWLAAGQKFYNQAYGSYDAKNDIAQIHRSTSAYGPWSMVWIHPEVNSFIYQLNRFTNAAITDVLTFDVWIVVGAIGDRGDAWYSIDDGATWNQVTIPNGVGRIYSVSYASVGAVNYWYWGTRNALYKSETLDTLNWSQASIDTPTSIMDMVSDDNNLILAGLEKLHTSKDGSYFDSYSNQGYLFDRVARITNDSGALYLAFMRSNLTQYTLVTSTNGISWMPSNNNITVTGYTLGL